jgi:hypothetical protein
MSVKRQVHRRDEKNVREKRFMFDPIAPGRSFGSQYGWTSPFIRETIIYLQLKRGQLPSRDETIVPMLVERAALGIIQEGDILGKRDAAAVMAALLVKEKDNGIEKVWIRCAKLYSMNEFLYDKLNETMRFIGDEAQEEAWRDKVRTLGPFALLLWDDPINKKPNTTRNLLYRGCKLNKAQLGNYQDLCQHPDKYGSFQAFTSCSRKRASAERFGNYLFIMEMNYAFTADLRRISVYPDEEEELVFPGVCFSVQRIEYDEVKDQHLIYITLAQRFNGECQAPLKGFP